MIDLMKLIYDIQNKTMKKLAASEINKSGLLSDAASFYIRFIFVGIFQIYAISKAVIRQ